MVKTMKDLAEKELSLVQGHKACAGCAAPIIVNQVLMEIESPTVVATATGCLEAVTSFHPLSSWNVPWIHNAFENVASTISGIEAAYQSFQKRTDGPSVPDNIKLVAFAGDGGTYDIGLQALSGALERGHDFTFVCYNNEAYMNTGIQRSSATPKGTWTTTSETGKALSGKRVHSKNLTEICIDHNIPYVGQATPSRDKDLRLKVKKAVNTKGPAFLNVISPCPRGWRFDPKNSIRIADEAVKTCIWPIYEEKKGNRKLTSLSRKIANKTSKKDPVEKFLKKQARFKHLFDRKENQILNDIQKEVDRRWKILLECSDY